MQIFITDICPTIAAESLDLKRVSKMITESCQMLSTAINLANGSNNPNLYKTTHVNHPSCLWARQNKSNFLWLLEHAESLSNVYTANTDKVHGSAKVLDYIIENNMASELREGPVTAFPNVACRMSMGIDYRHIQDVTEAYRTYLNHRWNVDKHVPKFGVTGPPSWATINRS